MTLISMTTRTRFAPSPTGYLHVGGLRTALFSYLVAKQHQGKFLLRIEDTDRERFVADGVKNIVESLSWAGIQPDEGVLQDSLGAITQTGNLGPYIQSERLALYHEQSLVLLNQGHAYYCFCTSERLEELRKKQELNNHATSYDGLCRKLDPKTANERVQQGEKHVVRMVLPKTGETVFNDLIRGEIRFSNALIDDQVIIKSDGFPTYHFAVVVDDHFMEITQVIRGEEWISSTPKHLKLYEYFGWQPPAFGHLPLLLNADRSKLSKRQGDVSVEDYRNKGYLPEALLNFVAFLGWNPGDDRELFTLAELVEHFSLAKVSKSGAVFNIEKLNWYNREYLKRLSAEEVTDRAMPWLKPLLETRGEPFKHDKLASFVGLEKDRVTTLAELPEALRFCFELPDYPSELLVWKKSSPAEARRILEVLIEKCAVIEPGNWQLEIIKTSVTAWINSENLMNGAVLSPLRVAVSGQQNSPGPFEIAAVLGKDETVRRLKIACAKL